MARAKCTGVLEPGAVSALPLTVSEIKIFYNGINTGKDDDWM